MQIDPRHLPDLRRLDRAIDALSNARRAAMAGLLFADMDGLVALEACRRLWQSDDLETLYGEIWGEAGCPVADDVDAALASVATPSMRRAA